MTVPFRSKDSALGVLSRLRPDASSAPLSAFLQVADRCNEVCVHCYQIQGQLGEVSTADWRRVLDDLAEMGVLLLTISGGESTLRDDLLEIIAYARHKKFAVKLFTNALRVDESMCDALADLAVQEVQISLYGPTSDVHDWVTGVAGSFDKVVRATRLLRERSVAVVLKSVLTSFNFEARHEYIALARDLGADYMLDPSLQARDDGDRSPQSFALTHEQELELRRDPELARAARPRATRDLDRPLCGACQSNVHVDSRGVLKPCSLLDVDLGNTRDGLRSAWDGEPARSIRRLTWRDIHGCRDCELQPYCNRCFAAARHESGDALGPYQSACERALLIYEVSEGVAPGLENEKHVGPFRRVSEHGFVSLAYELEERDQALRESLPWARGEGAPAPDPSGPGQLVQIRRPGVKRARAEVVPSRRKSNPPSDVAVDSD